MSKFAASKITNKEGTGATNLSQGLTLNGQTFDSAMGGAHIPSFIDSAQLPSGTIERGTWWFKDKANDSDTVTFAIYNTNGWVYANGSAPAAGGGGEWYGDRAIYSGGFYQPVYDNHATTMQYWSISTTSNASTFGYLTIKRYNMGAVSNKTRMCQIGGWYASPWTRRDEIDYVTVASTGNATDFGDISVGGTGDVGADGDSWGRGVFMGATGSGGYSALEYITIDTTGNSSTFSNMTISSSPGTPMEIAGDGTYKLQMFVSGTDVYVWNMGTTGSAAVDKGEDLYASHNGYAGSCGDDTYVARAGSTSGAQHISRITTQTLGGSIDFGDMVGNSGGEYSSLTCDNNTSRCIIAGRHWMPYNRNDINYFDITTASNASDFGDLTATNAGGGMACGSPS
jgi:hypothetical protein|tara:strand:+ start:281 stop:1474 length:1194 start_codon:yes stop_codon:yes gene_type:complete